jgi:hypothetical protein
MSKYAHRKHGALRRALVTLLLCSSCTVAIAQDAAQSPPPLDPDLEKPPPLPPKVQDEQIEPTVTIREDEERLIEEYSYNGKLYMVKITPKAGGVPYYYVDNDGDGTLELDEYSRSMNPVQPVYWKIAEWQ